MRTKSGRLKTIITGNPEIRCFRKLFFKIVPFLAIVLENNISRFYTHAGYHKLSEIIALSL